ncbi:TIGR02452 family protein [Halarsenatibacter silvermanii]|uniref:TIGR02452 family protein n=1 Tax=Halarsenatibacter silvermanii TaxID=321763 RepID=A0A1G9T7J1_9FIRM|nr:TIGR02452 family protein [Halarsenatibacter silvermanii]SDM43719.1 TIGR02452 family protein [Halarsenatibacter silvermanii]
MPSSFLRVIPSIKRAALALSTSQQNRWAPLRSHPSDRRYEKEKIPPRIENRGFLKGSGAQEESLARSSALYPAIKQMDEMYEANRKHDSSLYLDYMIFSPEVPVFRRDSGELLDKPYNFSFITAPAVNAGAVRENESKERIDQIYPTMKSRIEKILALACEEGIQTLVLGAFGCGVFRNVYEDVAEIFKNFLIDDERFNSAFTKIVFAVLDSSRTGWKFKIFQEKLKNN